MSGEFARANSNSGVLIVGVVDYTASLLRLYSLGSSFVIVAACLFIVEVADII